MQSKNINNPQGIALYSAHWAAKRPVAAIALVHGQGEHINRYHHFAKWFNDHQFSVVGIDLQGYGQSGGKRGHADSDEVLLDDIGVLLTEAKALYPSLPVYLYGHSMGGGLCLNYVARRQPALAGLIVTGPWVRLAFEAPALKVLVGRLLRRFMPALTLPTGLAAHFISRDPAVVKAYQNDPLVHDKLSAAAGIALLEAATYINAFDGTFEMPVLMMHGGDDKITSLAASKELAARAKGNITHKEWPGLYHEIHNEPSQNEVFAFTYDWILSKSAENQ